MTLSIQHEGQILRRVKYALSIAKTSFFLSTLLWFVATPVSSQVAEYGLQEFSHSSHVSSHSPTAREIEISLGDQIAPVDDLIGFQITVKLGQQLPADCAISLDFGGAWPAEAMPEFQSEIAISPDSSSLSLSWFASVWSTNSGHGPIGKILIEADTFLTAGNSFLLSVDGIVQVIDADLKRSLFQRVFPPYDPLMEVFPNPVNCGEELHVRGSLEAITMINAQGKEVHLEERKQAEHRILQTEGLSPGIWYVKGLQRDGEISWKKLLVR